MAGHAHRARAAPSPGGAVFSAAVIRFFRVPSPLALPALLAYALLLRAVPLYRALTGEALGLGASLAAAGHGSPLWTGLFGAGLPDMGGGPLDPAAASPLAGQSAHWLMPLLGALTVTLLGALVNRSMRAVKGLDADGWLPALAFVLLATVLGAGFNAATLGAACCWLAFDRWLAAYGPVPADEALLQAGVWTGLAALLAWPYALFLGFGILAGARLRPLTGREAAVFLGGFAAVLLLAAAWAYTFGHPAAWSVAQFRGHGPPDWPSAEGLAPLALRYALPLLVTLAAFAYAQGRLLRSLVLVRKTTGLAGLFGAFALGAWLAGVTPAAGAAFAGAYFLAYFARRSGWPRTWELGHALALAGWYAAWALG